MDNNKKKEWQILILLTIFPYVFQKILFILDRVNGLIEDHLIGFWLTELIEELSILLVITMPIYMPMIYFLICGMYIKKIKKVFVFIFVFITNNFFIIISGGETNFFEGFHSLIKYLTTGGYDEAMLVMEPQLIIANIFILISFCVYFYFTYQNKNKED